MNRIVAVAALFGLASIGLTPAEAGWVRGNGKSCASVCAAVSSGTYRHPDARLNGQRFFVCRADAGDGLRAGYNLKPNWSSDCWVGHGGQEKAIGKYDCLCQ